MKMEISILVKLLEKVYNQWPHWNATNMVVIDHNMNRVGCNPKLNIIISKPFYIEQLENLQEDNKYLMSTFWPLLQALFCAYDSEEFYRGQKAIESQGCMLGEGTMKRDGLYCK